MLQRHCRFEGRQGITIAMKIAYHLLTHLFGLGCIAACIAIVYSMGSIDIHWSGWIAIAYFAVSAVAIVAGGFPWRGRPLQILIKGIYTMSALALIGFGFSLRDPLRPQLWMVLAALGGAVLVRVVWKFATRGRTSAEAPELLGPDPNAPTKTSAHDSLF